MDLTKTVLGLELGSTRIKAVLLDQAHKPIASGSYEWENQLVNGVWTYSLDQAEAGVRACYGALRRDVMEKFGQELTTVGAIGISGMMHGYLAFDGEDRQLAEFRTWRNTMTSPAAEKLTALFGFNVPQRWSIAHLYQAILNGEEHVGRVAHLTTLAGWLHYRLTGQRVMGIGEASGMFPIDSDKLTYDAGMLEKFDALTAGILSGKLETLLPRVLPAGVEAGRLTAAGAALLDESGTLQPGIPLAPCEGDAGTGMTATNSVRVRTGNVSAGTSDFAMLVADRPAGVHKEIDMVTTPAGKPVAMVHCSNCTSDINAWVELFSQFADAIGAHKDKGELFTLLFNLALQGDADCGGLVSWNYFSGESIMDLDAGRPVFAREENCAFTLPNFMRMHLTSALATLKIGMDILRETENLPVDKLYGHGGFFKTPGVGQRLLSAAVNAPVSVMASAGEGGPYGMALLAAYMLWKAPGETLEDYLDQRVFAGAESTEIMADEADKAGFERFLKRYVDAFPVEETAVRTMR